jgi:hypothetical protein
MVTGAKSSRSVRARWGIGAPEEVESAEGRVQNAEAANNLQSAICNLQFEVAETRTA